MLDVTSQCGFRCRDATAAGRSDIILGGLFRANPRRGVTATAGAIERAEGWTVDTDTTLTTLSSLSMAVTTQHQHPCRPAELQYSTALLNQPTAQTRGVHLALSLPPVRCASRAPSVKRWLVSRCSSQRSLDACSSVRTRVCV